MKNQHKKRNLVFSSVIILTIFLLGLLVALRPLQTVRALEKRYSQVEKVMTAERVEELMNHEGQWFTDKDPIAYWDDYQLPEIERKRIQSSLRYSVSTFSLPVRFEFTFDEQRRVIGRHLYD